jgi:uncharacterized protein (DUF58 family)
MTMNTDLLMMDRDKKPLIKGRPWYVLALVLFLLSLIVQQPLLFLAALFSFVIGIIPGFWYHHTLHHLVVQRQVNPQRLFFGEEIVLTLSIENQKLFPVPWLEFESDITPLLPILRRQSLRRENLGHIANTWVLWSFQRVTQRYRMRCYARGFYTFGPITLSSSDPFGWLESKVTVPLHSALLVYPLIAPPAAFGLSSLHPFGEDATPHHLLEEPLRVRGVRDYQLGDDPRRIHWKATAHAGSLRSKIYEYSNQQRLLVLLDTGNAANGWMGMDIEMQEFCIAATASLAVWALDEGYMVGLLTNCAILTSTASEHTGASDTIIHYENKIPVKPRTTEISAPGVSVPFACGHGQYEHLLSMLARLVPYNNEQIETIIDRGDAMFSAGTTVILVSEATTLTQATVDQLLEVRTRGIAIQIMLTGDQESKNPVETYDIPVQCLGGRDKWHELIHTFVEENSQTSGTRSIQFQLD